MLQNFAKKIFGSANDRYIRRLRGVVAEIGQLESGLKPLSDEQLTNKTVEFKERLQTAEMQ